MSIDPIAQGSIGARTYEALWGRTFAHLYDLAFGLAERSGLRELRSALLAHAT